MLDYKMSYKGRFIPKNPKKYLGDPQNIIWRSLWERKVMVRFDEDPQIVQWGSEELAIPYISPIDNRCHLYYPDFLIKARQPNGTHIIRIVEVKPAKECSEPEKKKKVTKKYLTELMTYGVNQAKWKSATEFALDRGWQFVVLTENEIFGNGHK